MAGYVPLEASERWLRLLSWLAQCGALEPRGYQVRQEVLADEVAIPRRSLVRLIQRMEHVGVLTVSRTTVDGAFGSPRAANVYRLLMSPEAWNTCAEAVAHSRAEVARSRRAAARARQRDAGSRRVRLRGSGECASFQPLSEAEIDLLVAQYDQLTDEELRGW